MNTMLAAAFHGRLEGAGDPSPSRSTHSKPVYVSGHVSKDWNSFYNDWVHPVVNFGTPTLIVLATLLTLSVVVTPVLVGMDTRGMNSAEKRPKRILRGTYWFGVVCLLFSAVEATLVYTVARHAHPATWTAVAAIALVAVSVAVLYVLWFVVGGDQSPNDPGIVLSASILLVGTIAFILVPTSAIHLHWPWLNGQVSSLIYAGLLAIAGIAIAGRVRGISIGMLIQGHDKTGTDDAGLGAFVRAQLYAMGSVGPSGILITQQTDVDTLPSGALNLIPQGNLAKLAALFVSLFAPATPWRVDVVEQFDGSVIVSIRRNGKVAAAREIRASTLGLPTPPGPAQAPAGSAPASPGTASSSGDSGAKTPAATDWTAELRTAAAAFILASLSRVYEHLRPGLSGASQWLSVALQVIASDPTSQLSDKERRALLERALANDGGNNAAHLALLSISYRTASGSEDHLEFAGKFKDLLSRVENVAHPSPLELRLRFNLLVAYGNYAASLNPDLGGDRINATHALAAAKEQAEFLLEYWEDPRNRDDSPALYRSMSAAVNFAGTAIEAEWTHWPEAEEIRGVKDEPSADMTMTLLARYEYACALARNKTGLGEDKYKKALDELEIAFVQPSQQLWARTDPSLSDLNDVDLIFQHLAGRDANLDDNADTYATAYRLVARFKGLVGEPVTSDFLALSPFAPHRDALELRGVHNAEQLGSLRVADLVSDLSITTGEAARWRELARLHQWLASATPASAQAQNADGAGADAADNRATQLVYLLLLQNLDTIALTRKALTGNSLKSSLLSQARPWDVVAPGTAELSAWEGHDER